MWNDARAVLAMIQPGDRVLDVGGGNEVFPRADAVIDMQPYAGRKPGQLTEAEPERFGAGDWVVGDICTAEAWAPFADKSFDFVICSHVLEDVRDPIAVCRQLVRVGKAGYIEVPSRMRECAKGAASDAVTGYEHHRWIVDVEGDRVIFTQKNPWVHRFDYLGDAHRDMLANWRHQFTALHWTGSFDYIERSQKGSTWETANLFHFFETYGYTALPQTYRIVDVPHRGKTFEWITEFQLPVERLPDAAQVLERHKARMRAVDSDAGNLLERLGRRLRRSG